MAPSILEIIRKGAVPEGQNHELVQNTKDFRQSEAKILADMHSGDITLDEGATLIKKLVTSPNRSYEFQEPHKADVLKESLVGLTEIEENNRAYFLSQPHEVKKSLINISLTGTGENDLERIIKGKSGGLSTLALSDRSGMDEEALNNLEEIGFNAYRACFLKKKDSLNADPNPGGIIAVNSSDLEVRTRSNDAASGDVQIQLSPENFSKKVIAIVGFERVRGLHESLLELYSAMENYDPFKRSDGQYNEMQEREGLTRKFISHTILNDILKYLRT